MSSKRGPALTTAGSCTRHGRFWAVTDAAGQMVCLAVYKKGAQEVLRRLGIAETAATTTRKATTTTMIRAIQKGQGE